MNLSNSKKNQYDVISISHFFYPRIGGLENMAYGVMKYLASKGLKSIAVYGNDKDAVTKADDFDWVSFRCFKIFNKTYPIFGLRFALYIYRLYRKNPNAVVLIYDRHLTSSFISSIIARILNKKYIVVSQTTNSNFFKNKLFEKIANLLDNHVFSKVLSNAEGIISVSNANKTFIENHFNIDSDKISVIYNVFNEETIREFEIKEKSKTVVFTTKLIPVKDPNTTALAFLKTAERNPEWKFIFAGKGESILQDIENLPQNLDYIPRFLPQIDLFNLLSKSAIYINSSLQEGLSLGVIEAAALGNITILSDAPSNIELAGSLGLKKYTFQRGNVNQLVLKIEKAIKDFEEKKETINANKISEKAYNKFTAGKIFKQYLTYIKTHKKLNEEYNSAKLPARILVNYK